MINLGVSTALALFSVSGLQQDDLSTASVTFTQDKSVSELEVVYLEDDATSSVSGQELMAVLEGILSSTETGAKISYDFQLPQSELKMTLETIGAARHIKVVKAESGDVIEAWTVSTTTDDVPVDAVLADVAERLGLTTEGMLQMTEDRTSRAE